MKTFLTLFIFGIALQVSAQGIHFSDNREIPIQLNPAFAGVVHKDYVYRLKIVHRRQGNAVLGGGEFETSYFSVDRKWGLCGIRNGLFLGTGLEFLHDQVGFNFGEKTQYYHRQQANLNTSLGVQLSEDIYLIAGLRTGFLSRGLSNQNLTFDNQFDGRDYDGSLPTTENFTGQNRLIAFDIGTGFMLRGSVKYKTVHPILQPQNFEFGISLMHLNNQKEQFLANSNEQDLGKEFRLHTKLSLRVLRKFNLNPSLIFYKYGFLGAKGKQWQIRPTLEFPIEKRWVVASGMRISNFAEGGSNIDALIFTVKWKPYDVGQIDTKDNTIVGLSFDFNISPHLIPASNGFGAFEFFAVRYFTGGKSKACCPWEDVRHHTFY